MRKISDLDIKVGTKVLLRLDLNVPTNEEGKIVDDYRIQEALPTIKEIQEMGAKIIIIAHKESGTLKMVAENLKEKLLEFSFYEGLEATELNLKNGEIVLLENLRLDKREKENDESFAKELASLGEVYINEAFSASHRKHASIVGIPKYLPSAFGPKFIREVENLGLALNPKHPLLLIVGGAKFDTKLPMIEKFLDKADKIFVGGALAHSFWKAKNYNIGKSLLDEEVTLPENVLASSKILLPHDVLIEDNSVKAPNEITDEERIMDFGPQTLSSLVETANASETIVWNGPLGFYEKGFDGGTISLLKELGSMKDKIVILGGGDTTAVLQKLMKENLNLKYTHVSTAGGAMIEFLSNGTLPGILAIKD